MPDQVHTKSRQPIRKVAVVILNWNGCQDTLACVASVERTTGLHLDVIVSDNGSTDGSLQALAVAHPDVTVVANLGNLGFAAGNNAGIQHALDHGADAVLVLNNDTEVPPDAIQTLAAALDAHPRAAVACPAIAFAEQPRRWWFAGSSYDPARAHAGRNSPWETGRAPLPSHPQSVDRGVGAAMLVRSEVIRELGAFAPELFFLYEDVDWSLRMRAVGWEILLVPRAQILHKVASSQGGQALTALTSYYGTRNDLEMGRRHSGLVGLAAVRRELGCLSIHIATALRRAPAGDRWRCVMAALLGWCHFRSRRLGAR